MTSPQAVSSDVVAAIATTGIDERPPSIELTAGEEEPQADAKAKVKVEQHSCAGTISPEENKDKESEFVRENVGEEQTENELSRPVDDAALQPSQGLAIPLQDQQSEFKLRPHMMDYSQRGPINSMLAYADPFDLPQLGMNGLALPIPMGEMNEAMMQQPYLDPSPYIHESENGRISAYAKIEFEDGPFYMNTYQLILGRDNAAARAALRREEEGRRWIEEGTSASRPPNTPVLIKREGSRYSKSVVSESGGIVRDGDSPIEENRDERRRRRKASKKSKSTGSSSHQPSRRNSLAQPNGVFNYQAVYQARRHEPQTAGAVPVNLEELQPSPYGCPTVMIHPPSSEPASRYKTISRAHMKIAYNDKKRLFEAIILGRNGAFIQEEFRPYKSISPLKSGDRLQIGAVVCTFVLPDVAIGETGAEQKGEYDENPMSERYSEGGKEMSFDFENKYREGAVEDTSEDSSNPGPQDDEDGEEDEGGVAIEDEVDVEELDNSDLSQVENDDEGEEIDENAEMLHEESPKSEKKRGPGRPPKNGVMSKREEQLAKKEAAASAAQAQKQAQHKLKKTVPQAQGGSTPGKNKVGRPRKHPRPDTPPVQREKRKYTKRKPKEHKEGEMKDEGSGGEEVKEKKEKKPARPARSPTPQFREEDLTPEQLAKPQANYVTLIHEALSNSPAGQMSLPQIYRAIQRKYPYFVLKCTTNGWQSSVRHNLSQHHAFKKVERDGKGWMWAIVDGVSIEKEKKRRATPPPQMPPGHMHHQPIYPGHPSHLVPGPYGPGIMAPGYMINHSNIRPGQHPQYMGPPPPMNGNPYPPGPHPQINGQPHPQGYVPSIPQLAPTTGPQQYSSPYAPKPAPSTTSQSQPQPQPHEPRPPPDQKPPSPGPPPSTAPQQPSQQQQQPTPPQQQPQQQNQVKSDNSRPQHPQSVLNAVEVFRNTFMPTFKAKSDNAEAVVASAVNRVLGYMHQSAVPGDPFEDQIISALMSVLAGVPEFKANPHLTSAQLQNQQNDQRPPQSQTNRNGTQRSASQQPPKSTGSEKSAPTVMRPSFTGGPSRLNGPSVPRPPMMTPGMKRANSNSPAPPRASASSVSPAPAPSSTNSASNGASTPVLTASGNGQVAGQKRPLEDAEDMREYKRLSTSGPPQLKT